MAEITGILNRYMALPLPTDRVDCEHLNGLVQSCSGHCADNSATANVPVLLADMGSGTSHAHIVFAQHFLHRASAPPLGIPVSAPNSANTRVQRW